MSREEFISIITKKIDEAIALKEEADKEISFYRNYGEKYKDDLAKAYEKQKYALLLINELKSVVMLPIYERIQNMDMAELNEYRAKLIRENEMQISTYEDYIKKNEEKIKNVELEIKGLIHDFSNNKRPDESVLSSKKEFITLFKEKIERSRTCINELKKENDSLARMSEKELKKEVARILHVEDMREISEKRISNNVDEIMVSLENNPEIAQNLQDELEKFLSCKNTVNSEKIAFDGILELRINDFVKKLLNGTKNSKMKKPESVTVYSLEDISIIKQNVDSLFEKSTKAKERIDIIKKCVIDMEMVYNSREIGYEDIEVLRSISKKVYNDILPDAMSFHFDRLESLIDRYSVLSKKLIRTNYVKVEMENIKRDFKKLISIMLTRLLMKLCFEIRNFKDVINYDVPTGVLYLDLVDLSYYEKDFEKIDYSINDIPYEAINIRKLNLFLNTYYNNIGYQIQMLHNVSVSCLIAKDKLEDKFDVREVSKYVHYNNIQKIFAELTGTNYMLSLSCFEPLYSGLKSKQYSQSRVNTVKQETVDNLKKAGSSVDYDVDELWKIRDEILSYLEENDLNDDEVKKKK